MVLQEKLNTAIWICNRFNQEHKRICVTLSLGFCWSVTHGLLKKAGSCFFFKCVVLCGPFLLLQFLSTVSNTHSRKGSWMSGSDFEVCLSPDISQFKLKCCLEKETRTWSVSHNSKNSIPLLVHSGHNLSLLLPVVKKLATLSLRVGHVYSVLKLSCLDYGCSGAMNAHRYIARFHIGK